MPDSLPDSLRAKVIACVAEGVSAREAARRHGVSASSAIKWTQRWRASGSFAARPIHGHARSPLAPHAAFLLELARRETWLTLAAAQIQLRRRGVAVAISSVWRFYDRHGIRLRRRTPRKLPPAEPRTASPPA